MIKSNGGSGYVRNVLFQNFLARGTAYGLNVNQYWSDETTASGNGVQLSNIQFEVRPEPVDFLPCTSLTAVFSLRIGMAKSSTVYSAHRFNSSARMEHPARA